MQYCIIKICFQILSRKAEAQIEQERNDLEIAQKLEKEMNELSIEREAKDMVRC